MLKKTLTSFLLFISTLVNCQIADREIKGAVYATYKDFVQEKPTLEVIRKKGNYFNVSMATEVINVKNENTVTKYLPGSIYAYCDTRSIYRYYNTAGNSLFSGYFKVVEVGQIVIYEKLIYYSSKPGPRNSKVKSGLLRKVFYSLNLESPIFELNYNNLSTDFKDNSVALAEVNAINNSCSTCLTKQKKEGYVINTSLNTLAKRYPEKFNQKAINGSPIVIPPHPKKSGKPRHQPRPL